MLLQTVVLLLLCLSSGMCATLGHYQTTDPEEEAPAVDSQVIDGVVAAASKQEGVAAPDAKEPGLLAKIFAADNPAADKPEEDIPVANETTVEEPREDSDRSAEEAPTMEALTGEAPVQEQPSEEEGYEMGPEQTNQSPNRSLAHEHSNSWGLGSIRNSFQTVHGYFDSLVELVGGRDGVCEYRCRYGKTPQHRPGYQIPEPNGCSTSLVGFQVNTALDLGIPAMTECCNQLDVCYDTCGTSKKDCDSALRSCLHGICSDLKKSLGFVSKVQACESMADAIYNTVGTLGCRPYMNSQRAACICEEEERDEL